MSPRCASDPIPGQRLARAPRAHPSPSLYTLTLPLTRKQCNLLKPKRFPCPEQKFALGLTPPPSRGRIRQVVLPGRFPGAGLPVAQALEGGGAMLGEAKARFSEVVRLAAAGQPQRVTVHGRDTVVVVGADEFDHLCRLCAPKKASLHELLSRSPLNRLDFGGESVQSPHPRGRSLNGWLLDTNVVSELRKAHPDRRVNDSDVHQNGATSVRNVRRIACASYAAFAFTRSARHRPAPLAARETDFSGDGHLPRGCLHRRFAQAGRTGPGWATTATFRGLSTWRFGLRQCRKGYSNCT